MAQMAWEKPQDKPKGEPSLTSKLERYKFLAGGLLILAAVVVLVFSGTLTGARFFITIDDLMSKADYVGQTVRVTGVVIGDTIQYDARTGELQFTVAHVPNEFGDLATALHLAAKNPDATRMKVYMSDEAKPDLLQHEAQAILTGKLGEDGVFYANDLLLKCPSRFQETTPGNLIHLQESTE